MIAIKARGIYQLIFALAQPEVAELSCKTIFDSFPIKSYGSFAPLYHTFLLLSMPGKAPELALLTPETK